jgi:hypothetical protein
MLYTNFLSAGLVKRDTAADIENSLKNVFSKNDNPLEDLQVGYPFLLITWKIFIPSTLRGKYPFLLIRR